MLTVSELLVNEPIPLHRIHEAIFAFCAGRDDAIVFGAQAVNQYVDVPRMSQDVDLLSERPKELAAELATYLHHFFRAELGMATRVREVKPGLGYRVYQKRKPRNRHLADVRRLEFEIEEPFVRNEILFVPLAILAAMKITSWAHRRHRPKGDTDRADLRRLVLQHPHLREDDPLVPNALRHIGAPEAALEAWELFLAMPTEPDEDDGY